MLPYVASALIGAILMGRTKPKARVTKREVLGPRSGTVYQVDDFRDHGFLIVHGPGADLIFDMPKGQALAYRAFTGNADIATAMRKDFEP